MRKSKYRNKTCFAGGLKFDSIAESKRYLELKALVQAGEITDLDLQVKFELIPKVTICGRNQRACYYVCDFQYVKDGQTVVEDVKGFATDVYRIKRKLMKHVHGIDVVEIRRGVR